MKTSIDGPEHTMTDILRSILEFQEVYHSHGITTRPEDQKMRVFLVDGWQHQVKPVRNIVYRYVTDFRHGADLLLKVKSRPMSGDVMLRIGHSATVQAAIALFDDGGKVHSWPASSMSPTLVLQRRQTCWSVPSKNEMALNTLPRQWSRRLRRIPQRRRSPGKIPPCYTWESLRIGPR